MEDNTEDLTAAYMLGKYDGRKEAQAANGRCSDSAGSAITDTQRIDWLLRECELMRLDENGARFGEDLMDRDEIDAAILSQNTPDKTRR